MIKINIIYYKYKRTQILYFCSFEISHLTKFDGAFFVKVVVTRMCEWCNG